MTRNWILTILCAGLFSPTASVLACGDHTQRSFEEIAPDAKNLLVVQVESLALEPDSSALFGHAIEGRIRIVKRYRDAGDVYERVRFVNTQCHGIRVDVGGLYLVATNAPPPLIDLTNPEVAVVGLSEVLPFDVQQALKASRALQRLEAALNGNGTFAIDTLESRIQMSTELPPPRVPPPEDECWAQCTALKNGAAVTDRQ